MRGGVADERCTGLIVPATIARENTHHRRGEGRVVGGVDHRARSTAGTCVEQLRGA